MAASYKVKLKPDEPAVPFLGYFYPQEMEADVHTGKPVGELGTVVYCPITPAPWEAEAKGSQA